jgi:hypothetical protein
MVICSELQNLIFDRKEVNPGAPQFTQDSAWSEANSRLLRLISEPLARGGAFRVGPMKKKIEV